MIKCEGSILNEVWRKCLSLIFSKTLLRGFKILLTPTYCCPVRTWSLLVYHGHSRCSFRCHLAKSSFRCHLAKSSFLLFKQFYLVWTKKLLKRSRGFFNFFFFFWAFKLRWSIPSSLVLWHPGSFERIDSFNQT